MQDDIAGVLIPQERIRQRIAELAGRITADFSAMSAAPGAERQLTILPILTGAMIFAADLIRQLPLRMKIGLIAVSSYPGRSIHSQGANILAQQVGNLSGRHVLLVDDILDSGTTIRSVREMILSLGPASLRTCVLLRKPTSGASQTPVDYVGFDVPDEFVVGYGLDYDDHYRNLPDIVTLKRSVFERKGNEP